MSLIHKGGFRERANRNHRYKDSENQQANLKNQKRYQPKTQDQQPVVAETATLPAIDPKPTLGTEEPENV